MIRKLGICLCFAAALALTGCGGDKTATRVGNSSSSVNDVLEDKMAEESGTDTDTETKSFTSEGNGVDGTTEEVGTVDGSDEGSVEEETETGDGDVDVDLTTLSSNMVYAEVYSMVTSPDSYKGKVIKMKGNFASYYDPNTEKYYFACIIQDATACCSQGIEFELTEDYVYPDDYPTEGEEITVIGEFDSYVEGNFIYCTLRNAKLV